jgi:pimeloyl-ACP methyl ester carboxylesterase
MTRNGYADVGDLRMYYEIHGEGEPLLFLHGAYFTIDTSPIIPELAETRQVIAFELQGHGRTADADRPITYEGMADDAAAAVRQLGYEQLDVVGFSMGGGVALQFAIRDPGLVRRLVLISSGYRYDAMTAEAIELFPTITPEMFAGSWMEEEYKRLAPNPDDFHNLVRKLKELHTTGFAWPDEDIRGIAPPTLIVVGDSDILRLEHAVELFKLRGGGVFGDLADMPQSQLAVLPGTSHVIPPGTGVMDRMDSLLAFIRPFLERV